MTDTVDSSEASAHPGDGLESYSLEGGLSAALTVGLGLVLVIEGTAIHLWVASRSPGWAWALTAANVLTLVWLWREHAASKRSAMRLSPDAIEITAGRRLHCRARRDAIAAVSPATWQSVPTPAADYVNAAKPLDPNVLIQFTEPQAVILPLGIRRRITRIGVRAADPAHVVARLRGAGGIEPAVSA